MNDITQPLRLAVGSHTAGSGKGCAMNVISWESGDTEITATPDCSDLLLARVVQRVNDTICTHRDGDLLCPDCSVKVLDLGHRTVGTALVGWSDSDRQRVYVHLALDEAESVARPDEDARVTECRRVVQAWLDGKASVGEVRGARHAAIADYADAYVYAAAASAAAYAAAATYANYAADYAAYAAAYAVDDAYAAYAANAAAEAAYAADAAYGGSSLLDRAHALIDRFEQHTGIKARPVPTTITEQAITNMLEVA